MKAIAIERYGGPENLRLVQLPDPTPGPGQVRMRVAYAGVNPADWKDMAGLVAGFYDATFPHILGFDAAGLVDDVGEGVREFARGDRVFTASDHGGGVGGSWADYMIVPASRLARVPEGLSLSDAAAAPVAALTAWQALLDPERGDLKAGQRVLVHGASGGVGSYAVQIAAYAGAIAATTCSSANLNYVRRLGSVLALDYRDPLFEAALADWAPEGLDLIVDAVGGDTLPGRLGLLREGGRLVSIATLVADGDIAAEAAAARRAGKHKIFAVMDTSRTREQLTRIGELLVSGVLRPPPAQVFDLEDANIALENVRGGHVRGKLVLRVSGE